MRARYYDPNAGSFISQDPKREGLAWHSYARGNPIAGTDKSGKGAISDLIGWLDAMMDAADSAEECNAIIEDIIEAAKVAENQLLLKALNYNMQGIQDEDNIPVTNELEAEEKAKVLSFLADSAAESRVEAEVDSFELNQAIQFYRILIDMNND